MSEPIIKYVLGFMFRDNATSVVLVRKNKPAWQAGLLNGIGGKIEGAESPYDAMVREFREETGAESCGWRQYCEMSGTGFVVYCFTARDSDAWEKATTKESESIEKIHPDLLNQEHCCSNVHWLVEMALDGNYGKPFRATVRYSEPFSLVAENLTLRQRVAELEGLILNWGTHEKGCEVRDWPCECHHIISFITEQSNLFMRGKEQEGK